MNKNKYLKPELEVIHIPHPLQILATSPVKNVLVHDATEQTTGTGSSYNFYDPNNNQAGAGEAADAKRWSGGVSIWED
jgi:hypothetical protein